MTPPEQELHAALVALEMAVANQVGGRRVDLLPLFARIDDLGAALPADADPQLRHFLERKSFAKARLWLENRRAEITRGRCANGG